MTTQSNQDLIEEMRWQVAKIRDKQAENNELLGELDAAKDQLAALAAKVTSPDGTVAVTAGAGGIVQSVELSDGATGANARTLSATINATLRAAIAEATSQQLDIVRAHVGAEVEPAAVLGPQAKFASFAARPDASAGPTPARGNPVHADHDDEPFGSVFQSR